jgi:hypothetical protein
MTVDIVDREPPGTRTQVSPGRVIDAWPKNSAAAASRRRGRTSTDIGISAPRSPIRWTMKKNLNTTSDVVKDLPKLGLLKTDPCKVPAQLGFHG